MLPRVLEPEVMDTVEEAVDYDAMDHGEVNRVFVEDLSRSQALLGNGTQRSSASRSSKLSFGKVRCEAELCNEGNLAGLPPTSAKPSTTAPPGFTGRELKAHGQRPVGHNEGPSL